MNIKNILLYFYSIFIMMKMPSLPNLGEGIFIETKLSDFFKFHCSATLLGCL